MGWLAGWLAGYRRRKRRRINDAGGRGRFDWEFVIFGFSVGANGWANGVGNGRAKAVSNNIMTYIERIVGNDAVHVDFCMLEKWSTFI